MNKRLPATWISDLLPGDAHTETSQIQSAPGHSYPTVVWAIVLLLIAGAIGLVLPIESPFPYQYKAGETWTYNNLKAPFDFEVTRPIETVKPIIQSINSDSRPYYWKNPDIARQQKKALVRLIREQIKISSQDAQYADLVSNPNAYIVYGSRMLDLVFDIGIVSLRQSADSLIYISDGSSEQLISSDSLFSIQGARNMLTDSLPFSQLRQPELLFPILDQLLIVNTVFSDSLSLAIKKRKLEAAIGTGVKVQQGELIVTTGSAITPEVVQKLDSLASRYDLPDPVLVRCGYIMVALLSQLLLLFWIRLYRPDFWQQPRNIAFILAAILIGDTLFGLCHRAGAGIPLILPIFVLPLALLRFAGLSVGIGAWLILMTTTALSVSWGGAWWCIQMAGLAVALSLNPHIQSWSGRIKALIAILLVQVWAWLAAVLIDSIPEPLQQPEIALMLAVSALLSLSQSVLIRFTGIQS